MKQFFINAMLGLVVTTMIALRAHATLQHMVDIIHLTESMINTVSIKINLEEGIAEIRTSVIIDILLDNYIESARERNTASRINVLFLLL